MIIFQLLLLIVFGIILVILFASISIFGKKKESTEPTEKPVKQQETPPTEDTETILETEPETDVITEILTVLDDKFNKIDKALDTIKKTRLLSPKNELAQLKQEILQIEQNTLRKVALKQNQREQLKILIENIIGKIQTHEKQLLQDQNIYFQQKQQLQSKSVDLKNADSQEIAGYNTQIQTLKNILLETKKSGIETEMEIIEDEISKMNDVLVKTKKQINTQTKYHREQFLAKDKEFAKFQSELPTITSLIQKQEINKMDESEQKSNLLKKEISELKNKTEIETININKTKDALNNKVKTLKDQIKKIDDKKTKILNLLSYRKRLGNDIAELSEKIKLQEQKFLLEHKAKDEEIKKISVFMENKEKAIRKEWAQQEQGLINEQKQLENTISNLKNQLKKVQTSSKHNISELQDEAQNLQNLFNDKGRELTSFKKEKIKTEKLIKTTLSSKLNFLRSNFDKQTAEIQPKLKSKNNEIYTLKVRLSIREDKLRMDITKRNQLQEKLIEKLKRAEDSLRTNINQNMFKAEDKIKPYNKQIDTFRRDIELIEKNIREEQMFVEKIERKRMELEKEISVLEQNLTQNIIELENLIGLKNKQINIMGQEILEKENLIRTEHVEGQKLSHIDMLQKD